MRLERNRHTTTSSRTEIRQPHRTRPAGLAHPDGLAGSLTVGQPKEVLRRAASVPQVRFHDLRHVAQVFAAEAGATLPELMARLGHATPAAALIYLHARAERDHTLTSALGSAMESSVRGGVNS
jgi:integrase